MEKIEIPFAEQLEQFSSEMKVNPAVLDYFVNSDTSNEEYFTEDVIKACEKFEKTYEFVDYKADEMESPDFGRCQITGEKGDLITITVIHKELVRREELSREANLKLEGLSEENKKTFDAVFNSHIKQPEFRMHPELICNFKNRLADIFVEAEKNGITLKQTEPIRRTEQETPKTSKELER